MSDANQSRPSRRAQREAAAVAPAGSPVKGIVLIAVAVVVGFLLLQDESPSGADLSDIGGGGDQGISVDTEPPDDSTTTTTTPTLRPPAQVKVIVANGSGVNGAAGRATEELKTLGYPTGNPANAPERVPETQVLFQPGFELEARALAEAFGAPETGVQQMPAVAPLENLEGSQILVIVGPDLAQPGG